MKSELPFLLKACVPENIFASKQELQLHVPKLIRMLVERLDERGVITVEKSTLQPLTKATPRSGTPEWRRLLRLAERQLDAGRFEKAVASLERAIAAQGDRYLCTLRIADIYRIRQQWEEAFHAVEKAVALWPARLPAYELALTIALEAGDRKRIMSASQMLIKLDPRHLPAHNALGALYVQIGDTDAAIRSANTLARLDPHNAAHRFKKALLCQHKGEVGLAVQEFTMTIRLEPEGPHSAAAREALEILDTYQINQIATLAMEDAVFRAKLSRNPVEAVNERGFCLSEMGNHVLTELSLQSLSELPEPPRLNLYN